MPNRKHVIATNEGVATSICIGNYLSTGNLPCVYLQNSGLGNAINPLISVAHKVLFNSIIAFNWMARCTWYKR